MKTCRSCNNIVESDFNYCPYCGSQVFSLDKPSNPKGWSIAKTIWLGIGVFVFLIFFGLAFGDKMQSDYLQNEVGIKGSERTENKVDSFLSDTIKLNPDTISLQMNPFTYKTGIYFSDIHAETNISQLSSLGMRLQVKFAVGNLRDKPYDDGIVVTWKVKNKKTGAIDYNGMESIDISMIEKGELWTKSIDLIDCAIFYNMKEHSISLYLESISDGTGKVPVEVITKLK